MSQRNSLFNARIADSSANPSTLVTTDLASTSSLLVNSGSVDSSVPEYAGSIANLVQEIFGEFPTLDTPSASSLFLVSPLDSLRIGLVPEDTSPHSQESVPVNHESVEVVDSPSDDLADLLGALDEVAQVIRKLPVPRPPSLSPLEWCHALDSPEGSHPPWEDIYDLDESTMAIRHIRAPSRSCIDESGYASGSSSPSVFLSPHCDSPSTRNPKHLQIITDARLTPTIPSITHSPHSPRDIPLPQTPVDFDFMPASYDASSCSQSSRTKFRTGGFRDMILRSKRSASPSPVHTSFALNDQAEREVTVGTKKSDIRRLKSLLFREAADETGTGGDVVSFLDI